MQTSLRLLFPTLFLVVLLGFSSCNKDEVETAPLGSVNIDMYELLSYSGREFGFQAFTDLESYPVSYMIRSNTKLEGNKITVNLLDIEKVTVSGVAVPLGSASTYVNIGSLSDGEYDFEINVVDRINSGKLKIYPSFYVLSFDGTNGLTLNEDTLRRMPEGTLWGYLGYMDTAYAAPAQEFIDTLLSIGATPLNVAPGNYGYFEYSEDSVFSQPVDSKYTYTKEFYLSYNHSLESLNGIMYYYDFNYRQIYIGIRWFYGDGKKSVILSPGKLHDEVQLPRRSQ